VKELINCSVCGEEISIEANFCSSCGSTIRINDNAKEGNRIRKLKSRKQKTIKIEQEFQTISNTKILYLILSLALIGSIILYASGIFDSSHITSFGESNFEDVHQGVDLTNLNKINSLEEELKNQPNDSKLLELAHLLNDSGFKDKAIEKYKLYLKSNPGVADVLVDMGVCYYETGKNDEAIKWMKEALKYEPKHQIAHLNIGIVSMSSGKKEEAMDWWKKTISINPNNNIGKRAQDLINQK
jgi:tetratricopeptide (TPR) repeat protein